MKQMNLISRLRSHGQITSPSSVKPLRIAIIGTGGISSSHARAILHYGEKVECVALCDVDEGNLRKRNEQLGGGKKCFGDWNVMLSEYGGQFDAVAICLPHHLHSRAILDCAAAGKHILCEKPLCITLEEAQEIIDTVKRTGITFMPGHNALFAPFVARVKQSIDSGLIGRVLHMRSQACFLNRADFSQAWRGRADLQGGGELIDTGYHGTYSLLYFAGSPVVEVKAVMGRFRHRIQGEDTASVQILFENGSIGEIFTSWATARPHGTHDLHIIGEKGELFGSDNTLFHLREAHRQPDRIDLPKTDTFTEQMSYFVDCVREGKRPLHSVEESREVLRVILDATKSAAGWEKYAALKV
jgi:predicted dehydrogenase